MTTSEGRVARIEGVLEQINERLGNIEAQNLRLLDQKADNERVANIGRILEQKADKNEVRLLFATTITLLAALIGIVATIGFS
jgi:C4-type Zn-finger protein